MYAQTSMLEQWFSISFMIRFHQGSNESHYDNPFEQAVYKVIYFSKICFKAKQFSKGSCKYLNR